MTEVPRVSVSSPADFYERFVARSRPVMLADAARVATRGVEWTDDFMLDMCTLGETSDPRWKTGQPWRATIEKHKVIVSNTRFPLVDGWTFCDFIQNYTKPEHSDGLYCISPRTLVCGWGSTWRYPRCFGARRSMRAYTTRDCG